MNKDQTTIKKNIEEIFAAMTSYLPQINAYRERADYAEKTFAAEYANAEKQRALEQLKAAALNTQEKMLQNLDTICEAATALEHQPFTEEIMPALTLLEAAGDQLPSEMRRDLLRPFIGNKQALLALKAAFDNQGISVAKIAHIKGEPKDLFATYIFDAQIKCDKLKEKILPIFHDPVNSAGFLLNFWKEMECFAKLEGVELTVSTETDKTAAQFVNEQFRAAAGLSV